MVHLPWFILPSVQEYYYRKLHPEYGILPPYRPDCAGHLESEAGREVMNLIYPDRNTEIYIPVDLDGCEGHVVFEAVHRDIGAIIYWHMDDFFLASTRQFHQISLRPAPGEHRLVLVDEDGNRLERCFHVLNPRETGDLP
jgi:penicillin-binding protein 1C